MRCPVVVLCREGLKVDGEIDSGARSVLDGPISDDRWLHVYDATCSRPGQAVTEVKEIWLSMKHLVSWRDGAEDPQEALDVEPEERRGIQVND